MFLLGIYNNGKRVFGSFLLLLLLIAHNLGNFLKNSVSPFQILKLNGYREFGSPWRRFAIPLGFPGGSEVKASACSVGDLGSIPGLGRSPGEGNGNPLQYSCLENLMDRGAWWAILHRIAKSQP